MMDALEQLSGLVGRLEHDKIRKNVWELDHSTDCRKCAISALLPALREQVERAHVEAVQAAADTVPPMYNDIKLAILSITPAAAHIRAELRMARARLEEAEWWEHLAPECETLPDPAECLYCQRMHELRATVSDLERQLAEAEGMAGK